MKISIDAAASNVEPAQSSHSLDELIRHCLFGKDAVDFTEPVWINAGVVALTEFAVGKFLFEGRQFFVGKFESQPDVLRHGDFRIVTSRVCQLPGSLNVYCPRAT